MTDIQIPLAPGHWIAGRFANRHGLIAGATGTGKTVTIEKLSTEFSRQGVPVFLADVKGDISGIATSGLPVQFFDVFGQKGQRLIVALDRLGSQFLARTLDLSDVQTSALDIAFRYAGDHRLPLATLDDLRKVLNALTRARGSLSAEYGLISQASLFAILRAIGTLGVAHQFFGAPTFDVAAETLPTNPFLDAAKVIGEMGVGEALVSTIGPTGVPKTVARVRIGKPSAYSTRTTKLQALGSIRSQISVYIAEASLSGALSGVYLPRFRIGTIEERAGQ